MFLEESAFGIPEHNADAWAKESSEIATKIAYRNGGQSGSRRGGNKDCAVVTAGRIADRLNAAYFNRGARN